MHSCKHFIDANDLARIEHKIKANLVSLLFGYTIISHALQMNDTYLKPFNDVQRRKKWIWHKNENIYNASLN